MEGKPVFNATQVVERVNQLLKEGRKMRVFGLPYPPVSRRHSIHRYKCKPAWMVMY